MVNNSRAFRDEICIEEGCFGVRDALRNPFYKIPVERQLFQTNPQRVKAVAMLEVPEEKTISNMDSRSWNVVRKHVLDDGLEYVMTEAALVNGGLLPNRSTIADVLIIGIGSGALANYIQYTYPASTIIMLERRAKMARFLLDWFQLYPTPRFKIYADDVIRFVHELAEKGSKFHVVFFNVCPVSYSHLPCPTARDLPEQMIHDIAKLVDHTGTFVVNLMTNGIDATGPYEMQKHRLERYFNECLLFAVLSCSQTFHDRSRLPDAKEFLDPYSTKPKY
ncbi:hypothetical protein Aduo_010156 [Ancylostoma duodenale]